VSRIPPGLPALAAFHACYDRRDPREAPLHRSDSSPDGDAPVDLPLREETPETWEATPSTQRYLFESTPALPGGDVETRSRAGIGISIWLVAAAALVVGIVIGFASGYTAGQRADLMAVLWPPAGSPVEAPPGRESPQQPAADRPFTEGTIPEPVRVDPDPIATVPEPPPATEPAAGPAPRAPRAAPVDEAASGPGSLNVVSRPSGAEVFVDGRVVGRTPLVISNVPSGAHNVRMQLSGFRRWATTIQVRPGARTRVAASLEQ
jgi:hypothetical protein